MLFYRYVGRDTSERMRPTPAPALFAKIERGDRNPYHEGPSP